MLELLKVSRIWDFVRDSKLGFAEICRPTVNPCPPNDPPDPCGPDDIGCYPTGFMCDPNEDPPL